MALACLALLVGCVSRPKPAVIAGVSVNFGAVSGGPPGQTVFQFTPGVPELDRRIALARRAVAARNCRWSSQTRAEVTAQTRRRTTRNNRFFLVARTTC